MATLRLTPAVGPLPPLLNCAQGVGGIRQSQAIRLVQTSPGYVVDKFVPVPKNVMPSIFSGAGWALRWANLKGLVRSTLSVARIRQRLPDWKPIPFAEEVQQLFEQMNRAFVAYASVPPRLFGIDRA